MKVRSAAQLGIILVIANLILRLCTHGFYLVSYLPNLLHHSGSGNTLRVGGYFIATIATVAGDILLNVALLLVLGSLCRTKEQFFHDNPDIQA